MSTKQRTALKAIQAAAGKGFRIKAITDNYDLARRYAAAVPGGSIGMAVGMGFDDAMPPYMVWAASKYRKPTRMA